jgi:hypothetical protein
LGFVGIPEDKLAAAQAAVDAHMRQFKLENGFSRFPLAFQLLQAATASARSTEASIPSVR